MFSNQANKNIHSYSNGEAFFVQAVWCEPISHTTLPHNDQGYNVKSIATINLCDRYRKGLKGHSSTTSFSLTWGPTLQMLPPNFKEIIIDFFPHPSILWAIY